MNVYEVKTDLSLPQSNFGCMIRGRIEVEFEKVGWGVRYHVIIMDCFVFLCHPTFSVRVFAVARELVEAPHLKMNTAVWRLL